MTTMQVQCATVSDLDTGASQAADATALYNSHHGLVQLTQARQRLTSFSGHWS